MERRRPVALYCQLCGKVSMATKRQGPDCDQNIVLNYQPLNNSGISDAAGRTGFSTHPGNYHATPLVRQYFTWQASTHVKIRRYQRMGVVHNPFFSGASGTICLSVCPGKRVIHSCTHHHGEPPPERNMSSCDGDHTVP